MKNLNGLILLRFMLAIIFITHSLARIYNGTVIDFGEKFLDSKGFAPIGLFLAMMVTAFEFVGSMLLMINRYVLIVSLVFIVQMVFGIALVHLTNGWFVVGSGVGGVEYSLLIIVSFLAIAFPQNFKLK